MSRETDRRDFGINRVTSTRETELRSQASAVSDRLPGPHRVKIKAIDALTGNPSAITSESAPAEKGNYIQRALAHVKNVGSVLGLTASQASEYAADPTVQQSSSGAVAVYLQQMYKGIAIFQAAETVRFAPNGTLKDTVGCTVSVGEEKEIAPKISIKEAVKKAAEHVAVPHPDEQGETDPFGEPVTLKAVDLTQFIPKVIGTFPDKADHSTLFEAGPFGDKIKAGLIWFPLDNDLRLAWEVIITMPDYEGQFRTMVDADNGDVLYCRQLLKTAAARGNVYTVDGGAGRQMVSFPRPLHDYAPPIPNDLPDGFPDDWVNDHRTEGNNVNAHLGSVGSSMDGTIQEGVVTFDFADSTGDDQKVLNIFYYNCYMHDYFYLLGFREAAGNFQDENFGRGGIQGDRVDARAHSGAVTGTANMFTPVDGSNPVMNMGLVTSTNRHTAFDSTVVFHEFMHGVTNRLVGGAMNSRALDADQSGGMGEGWGDYIACTINDVVVVGAWVVNRTGGIRAFPYDANFPDSFGDLGTGRYTEVHNIGEIWCATLMEMNRNIGAQLGVQLVVDALKLSPANPSFLDMRDAILSALTHMLDAGELSATAHADAEKGTWKAFAKFGMGPGARSNGASLSGIEADFNVPSGSVGPRISVDTTPDLPIPDNQPSGIRSTLTISQTGRIKELIVSVDIEHTYIGDLQVKLTAPNGGSAILHNRGGASTNNLVRSYSDTDTSDLSALVGQQTQGAWVLEIADLAAVDVGKLRRWGLDIALESASQIIRAEASPSLAIPDNDPTGVSDVISISQSASLHGIKVDVDITHTFIGDLRVSMLAPSGRQAILHNRSGGGQDNLITSYDSLSSSALSALVGEETSGNWVLQVTDLAGRDIGKLNKWSLEFAV
jgi:extracellular elastinolytic metalloproteinase